jgi:MucR family transcriptional regulator, transcriptional regulator of exopolysaccharide biosynthesis
MADEQDLKLQRQMTAEIIAAYASNHKLSGDQLAALISTVHAALVSPSVEPEPERTPAVPIRRSVHRDYVVCLECGWGGQTLRRHIATRHQLSPTEYRSRWGLSAEHLLTAPGYSEWRSAFAKGIGLGRHPQGVDSADGGEPDSAEPQARPRRKTRPSRRPRREPVPQS